MENESDLSCGDSDRDFVEESPRGMSVQRGRDQDVFQEWVAEFNAQRDHYGECLNSPSPLERRVIASPREYQVELFERAKEKNIIVVLPTGSGKTLIAVMLLRHAIEQNLEQYSLPRKTAFMVVDKVALCMQQYEVIKCNLEWPIAMLFGDSQAAGYTETDWSDIFREHAVVVCTAQILLDCLDNGFIDMSQISLLIFDEAHHAKKNHPYACIMKRHYPRDQRSDAPKILGLTASPIDTRDNNFRIAADDLEALFCSEIATVSDDILDGGLTGQQIADVYHFYKPLHDPLKTELSRKIEPLISGLAYLKRYNTQVESVASILGPWCADRFWQLLLTDETVHAISARSGANDTLTYNYGEAEAASKYLEDVQNILSDYKFEAPKSNIALLSSKVYALHGILQGAFSAARASRCIVFVDQRYTARLLADLFSHPEFAIPRMTGHYLVGISGSLSFANMSLCQRIETLEGFRRGDINCLFATSVAEEGIDVPECDQIIRFDLCSSAIQYVQSKGRARKSSSIFTLLLEEGNIHHARSCLQVTTHARAMRQFCISLPDDRKVGAYERAREKELKVGDTAVLSLHNSKAVLSKFTSTLATGIDYCAAVDYLTVSVGGKFVCTAVLPESAPIRAIDGHPEKTKTMARGSAAYEACQRLIDMGYINKNLQPVFKKKLPKMRSARLALSPKHKVQYDMKLRPGLWTSFPNILPTELYQCVISFSGSETMENIMFLSRSLTPDVPQISLFLGHGNRCTATWRCGASPACFSRDEVTKMAAFTLKLFCDVFSKEFEATADSLPYYVVPCRQDDSAVFHVHWSSMEQPAERPLGSAYKNTLFIDPFYGSRKFVTLGVNSLLRPLDSPPKGVPEPHHRDYATGPQSIIEYSCSVPRKKREGREWDLTQPVIDAKLLSLRRNFLEEDSAESQSTDQACTIILEPLKESIIPVSFARSALLLPSILYRMQSVLITLEAFSLLGLHVAPQLALDALTRAGEDPDTLDPRELQQDLGVSRNYERLELLGDSFLKMATTIALYSSNPKSSEFVYHVERMLMVCNKNLFNTAMEFSLHQYIRSTTFDRRTWYLDLPLKRGKQAKTSATHLLPDKTVADVCEAVIGAAYVASREVNMNEAVKAVTKVVNSPNHTMVAFEDYYAAFKRPSWHLISASGATSVGAERVGRALGYSFTLEILVRSALKHPSYPYENIPDYQQLEFLGDALLETAVVDYLYFRFPNAGPQWLTEHKMSMCSNQFLGFLCVRLGLHRGILTTDAQIPGQISLYESAITQMEKQGKNGAVEQEGELSLDFWLEIPHPPKVLADVMEALLGAMFVDSGFSFTTIQQFVCKIIAPYFSGIGQQSAFGPGQVISDASQMLTNKFGCRKWRFCVTQVPCSSKDGRAALTKSDCVCALLIHEKVVWHCEAAIGREAKCGVARIAVTELEKISRCEFRQQTGCNCTE